ncbi:MAG: TonB-dependent receptor plug domain-containing protein [Steroidobacteraceae bacterium]
MALQELAAAARVQLVYTTEIVPASAIVRREPVGSTPLEAIAQVVVPLGLSLRRIDSRTYALVRSATAPDPASTAAATPPVGSATALDEVVVTASRYSLAADTPDVHALLAQGEVDALPRLAEDALKAVHRLPGAASNGLSGLAHLRGGDTNETLVLFDGLPLYEPFHLRLLQSPSSVLDERIIGTLDAYAGGYTAEFGDRMSGIIDARSVRPEADAYYELGLSLVHANALASRRFADDRGQWLVSIRRSNLDEVSDWMESDLGEPQYMDGFARVDYAWSPATRGSLHVLLASDSSDISNTADTERADVKYSNAYVWGTLEHDWSARLSGTAILSFTDVAAEREATVDEPGLSIGKASDHRDYDVLGLKLDARYAGERWLQRMGLELRSLSATYDYHGEVAFAPDYPFPGAVSFVRDASPTPSGEHVAAYYTVRGNITPALTAELGLRWDEQTYGADADDQLGPRINLAWRVGAAMRLLASWGRFQQFEGIEELPVEDGVTRFDRSQSADHSILGLEHALSERLLLRVEAYRKDYRRPRMRYENLYDPLSLAPELRWDRVAVQPATALAEGAELLLTLRASDPWTGWFSYSWSRATDRIAGSEVRRSWDQAHTFNAGVGWAQGPWRATVATQYHTGWPVTPVGLDADGDVVLGKRNASRYSYFGSLDARLSHDWHLQRGTLTAHLDVTNSLDRRNPCCTDLTYSTAADGTATLDRELRHWLPLIPSVGVLWKF